MTDRSKLVSVVVIVVIITVSVLVGARQLLPRQQHGTEVAVITASGHGGRTQREVILDPLKSLSFPVTGSMGPSVIEVKDGLIRIAESACPDKICRDFFGWIGAEGEMAVCLPNQIWISIEAIGDHDETHSNLEAVTN